MEGVDWPVKDEPAKASWMRQSARRWRALNGKEPNEGEGQDSIDIDVYM